MRLFYLSNTTIPSRRANSIQVMRMCEAFAALGHKVTLVYPARRAPADSEFGGLDVWGFYGVETRFELLPMETTSGIGMHKFGFQSAQTAIRAGADAAYGRFLPSVAWAAWAGVPSVLEIHQPIAGMTSWFYLSLLGYGKRLHGAVAITRSLADHVMGNSLHRANKIRVRVEPDGTVVGPPRSENDTLLRAQLGIPPDRFTAVYTGHLYAGRGVEVILELAARNADIRFVVVGGEREAVTHYREITDRRSLHNVSWIGFIPPSNVFEYMQLGNVLLMPYQRSVAASSGGDTSRWMSPLKMFEYMAAGRPIIASDLPALREVLHDQIAFFCGPDDLEAWSHALRLIRDEPARFHAMGQRAQSEVRRYSWIERARRCLDLYD